MSIEETFVSHSEADTEEFAAHLAASLPAGNSILLLRGDLGAGKTVFARGFARGLGITEPVSSPTYTIAQEYELPRGGRLCHLDLYRISDAAAGLAFGVDEILDDPSNVVLIEWPDRIASLLPKEVIEISIRHLDDHTRELRLTR